MQSAKAVEQKSKVILNQADKDGNGTLSIDEFLVCAEKFPNILFPAYNKKEEEEG